MKKGKIIIAGPGRSGTTFLIRALTRLGFDTGMPAYDEHYNEEWRAGGEWVMHFHFDRDTPDEIRQMIAEAPRVLKTPEWSLAMKRLLAEDLIDIDHVILPIRDLDVSAKSRVDVGLDWLMDENITEIDKVEQQANILAYVLGRAVEACTLFEIPTTIMRFPALVIDKHYCHHKLVQAMWPDTVDWNEFSEIFDTLANPEQIKWK